MGNGLRFTAAELRRKGFVIDDQLGTAAPQRPITLILPYPPSTWKLYHQVGTRKVLTQEARDYRTAAVRAARYQYGDHAPLQGRLKIMMELHQPYERGLDIDNAIKACFDSLTHALIWHDDSQIDELSLKRFRHAANPHSVLTIEEFPRDL